MMRHVPSSRKVDIARSPLWYQSGASVASCGGVLVCAFRRSDQHLCTTTDIMVARSLDGGRQWTEARSIAHLDVQADQAVWVIPQISALRDGRLVIICDRGVRRPGEGHVSLYHWQLPERGMGSWLFWSADQGQTWSAPVQIDRWGGQPSYVDEWADGTLAYTRTEAKRRTSRVEGREYEGTNPPYAYYACGLVTSTDAGASWHRRALLADDPLFSDAEVGLFQTADGRLHAHARCCDHGSFYGQPSRAFTSEDGGRSWSAPRLLPYYGHRISVHRLGSGKALATFRNAYGTTATYAFLFDPDEAMPYSPNSFIWQEDACRLAEDGLLLDTDNGTHGAVEFVLYPAEDADTRVELEFELRVVHAAARGCSVSAGAFVHFLPGRIHVGDCPEIGVNIDTTTWRRYRLVRENRRLVLQAGGSVLLDTPCEPFATRQVRFGNRPDAVYFPSYHDNRARSLWRSFRAVIANRDDHAVTWSWSAEQGFPDQYRRDRFLCLDRCERFHWGDNGYSGWAQLPTGEIVVTDYTAGHPGAVKPFVRAYLLREEDWQ